MLVARDHSRDRERESAIRTESLPRTDPAENESVMINTGDGADRN